MSVILQTGYLETAYLSAYPYLSGQIHEATGMQAIMTVLTDKNTGMQAEMFIVDRSKLAGMQTEMFIADDKIAGMQAEMTVNDSKQTGMQSLMQIQSPDDDYHAGMQVEMQVIDQSPIGMQTEMFIEKVNINGQQAEMFIQDKPENTGMQAEMNVLDKEKATGMQVKQTKLAQWLCEKYLNNKPYLTDSYLAGCIRAFQGMQAEMYIVSPDDDAYIGMQTEMVIKKESDTGLQAEMIVETEVPTGMQALQVRSTKVGMQATMVIYNTSQLRILCTFDNRGTPSQSGLTWLSIQPIRPGDFSPNNLNTDIIEQRTETNGVNNLWELRCDTGIPQGSFVDTLAILNHNFTTSARVTFQGSNDAGWGTVGESVVLQVEPTNIYYIAPTLPTSGYRYRRLLIEDSTNPSPNLSIGCVLFGASGIFTVRECFENPVTFGAKHYKDTIQTEGFTNVSNDRATRKYLGLTFKDLDYNKGNFALLKNYFDHAKTDLKCLIIPRPSIASAFAVFAKLVQLPEESHVNLGDDNHHVTLSLEWDESL